MVYYTSRQQVVQVFNNKCCFEKGIDPDIAQVQVNNKVQQILPRLPEDVRKEGVNVVKAQSDYLMIFSIHDESGESSWKMIYQIIWLVILKDGLQELMEWWSWTFGAEYAMRIWLDPKKLKSYNLMPSDINKEIMIQNTQASGGSIGARPQLKNQRVKCWCCVKNKIRK